VTSGRLEARRGRVVIVGGGVAGLAAAYFLRDQAASVIVLEGAPRIGGKLAVAEVAGHLVDVGAEALLARRPEAIDLITELGLADQLVYPGSTTARIWTRGTFRSLPRRQFMGVPGDLDELERSEIVSPDGLARAREDAALPETRRTGDVSVASYVGTRLGAEVVDRLVEPLLGGVYAGRPEQLSYEATLPALAKASLSHRSLTDSVNALLPPPAGPEVSPPVFTSLAAGAGTLPRAIAEASGATVRTKATVRELARTSSGGWRLTVGPAIAPEYVEADAVILALPARPASRLIAQLAGTPGAAPAAADLASIEYASMAIVTLAYEPAAFPEPLTGSGYLVPAVDGRAVKAATFSTIKWPHLLGGREGRQEDHPHFVRCSLGRIGEEAVLQRDDADLVTLAAADLAAAAGVRGAPAASLVTRWGGGLPQYTVGHLDRVSRIRAWSAATGSLAVCGAAYDGIGVPACIASARLAADQVADFLGAGFLGVGFLGVGFLGPAEALAEVPAEIPENRNHGTQRAPQGPRS
jgi:oxygen-dependent protoporphyrinogen oxidase